MSKKASVKATGASPAVVTGEMNVSINKSNQLTKEVTMKNTTTVAPTKKSINIPTPIEKEEAKLELEQAIEVKGGQILLRQYDDGYLSVNKGPFEATANKVVLNNFGQAMGLLSAITTLKLAIDNDKAIFEHGVHAPWGLKPKWQSQAKNADVYVQWDFQNDKDIRKMLKEAGIVPDDYAREHARYWIGYETNRNRFELKFVNVCETWKEFQARMKAEKFEEGTLEYEDQKNWYDKAWNTQNKHDGIEIIRALLDGEHYVGIQTYFYKKDGTRVDWQPWQVSRYNRKLQLLLDEVVEIRAIHKKAQEDRNLGRKVQIAALADEVPAEVQKVVDAKTVKVLVGEVETKVKKDDLVGQKVEVCYPDGSLMYRGSHNLYSLVRVDGALRLAANGDGILRIVEG